MLWNSGDDEKKVTEFLCKHKLPEAARELLSRVPEHSKNSVLANFNPRWADPMVALGKYLWWYGISDSDDCT